jgi:periplasmic protein TonB
MNPNFTRSIIFLLIFLSFQSFGQSQSVDSIMIDGVNEKVYYIVDEPADFPGGRDSIRAFIKTNLQYPVRALNEKIEGKCYISFNISCSGKVSNVKIKKGVPNCPECDAEAIRILKIMPLWKPACVNKENVNSFFSLPIAFKL